MAMESAIVIKVKYEETLRRFNACVIDEKLDLNIGGLREKIIQLFNFAHDAELTLTYIDEDGDVVTLVDDEDLQDVMRQDLNPLRISVRLNAAERSGRPSARSSGTSTPLQSPRVQPPFFNLNSRVSDFLKSVPEPLREAVMKICSDRTTSATPILAELVDAMSKMGPSYYQNQASGPPPVKEAGSHSGTSNGNTMSAEFADGGKPNVKSGEPFLKKTGPLNAAHDEEGTLKTVEPKPKVSNEVIDGSVKLKSKSNTLEGDRINTLSSPFKGPKAQTSLVNSEEKDKKFAVCHIGGKAIGFSYLSASPILAEKPSDEQQPSKGHQVTKPVDLGGSASSSKVKQCNWDSPNADSSGSSIKIPCVGFTPFRHLGPLNTVNVIDSRNAGSSGSSMKMPYGDARPPVHCLVPVNPVNECPFSGLTTANNPISAQNFPFEVPLKRSHNHSDGTGTIFHKGVRCDGCGVHPITGPRFISKVKENYDLCSICFAEMGNDADYIRMDHPLAYPHPLSFKGLHALHRRLRPPTVPKVSRGYGLKSGRPKLDSRFIQDVNILDGTIMAPLTRFTKIWKIKNNGNLVWPQGTQLIWIGGDKLSDRFSVELEITTAGLAVDQELDVAVDFTAPEHPGRYISYWRLESSSGQKFGQRVWVLIQVDALNLPKRGLVHEAFQGLNLNLPPPSFGMSGPDIINVNPEPQNVLSEPKSCGTMELVDSEAEVSQNKEQEAKFPINDSLLVGFGDKSCSPSTPGSPISYPIIALTEEASADSTMAPSAAIAMQAPLQDVRGNNEVEMSLLQELEEMGFIQVDLNKEILRKNEYDLEQSVDDLCGVIEWDPILEELEEMGFCDKEMNKKLLKKNNGSIKRVVMDLIAGEQ